MTKETKTLDPMLVAAIDRLQERGPSWNEDEASRWGDLFLATVAMVYPAKARRKSRAKQPAKAE